MILPAGAAITGRSAALVWGVKLCDYDGPVEVTASKQFGPVSGLRITLGRIGAGDVTVRWGLPLTTVPWTAWQLGRSLPLPESVVWVDALGRARGLSKKRLTEQRDRRRGQPGSRQAAIALDLCDPRAESPPETRLRLAIVAGGLPAPVPQYSISWSGEFVARVDLAWPELRFAVEYDGQWHADRDQLADDRERLRVLTACGWQVYHVTSRDMHDIDRLLRDLAAALRRRAQDLGIV